MRIEIKLGDVQGYSATLRLQDEKRGVSVSLGSGCTYNDNRTMCNVEVKKLGVYITANEEFNDKIRVIVKNEKTSHKAKVDAIEREAAKALAVHLSESDNLVKYVKLVRAQAFEEGAESARGVIRAALGVGSFRSVCFASNDNA
jgi:hypothetical protein